LHLFNSVHCTIFYLLHSLTNFGPGHSLKHLVSVPTILSLSLSFNIWPECGDCWEFHIDQRYDVTSAYKAWTILQTDFVRLSLVKLSSSKKKVWSSLNFKMKLSYSILSTWKCNSCHINVERIRWWSEQQEQGLYLMLLLTVYIYLSLSPICAGWQHKII